MSKVAPRPRLENFVYVIGNESVVKIGTSANPWRRLQDIRVMSALPVDLIVKFPGGFGTEKWLHGRFDDYHYHGEWFRRFGRLDSWIARLRELNQSGVLTRTVALRAAGARVAPGSGHVLRSAWEMSPPSSPGLVMLAARRAARSLKKTAP